MELAQINIGRLRYPLEAPEAGEFVAALAPVNALADAAPGFVWRLATADGDATAIRAFDDDRVIVNLSVWRSLEALRAFVYGDGHVHVLRRRLDWFERPSGPHTALWWVPVGTRPDAADGRLRLERLAAEGPAPAAFTFQRGFDQAGLPLARAAGEGRRAR